MEDQLKTTESLSSADPDKVKQKQKSEKKKSVKEILFWQTRRKSIEAVMCITLNMENMLQLTGALITHGGVVWITYFTWAVLVGVPMITAEIALGRYINNEIKYVWAMCRIGKGIFWNCLLATFAVATLCHIELTILLHFSIQPYYLKYNSSDSGSGNDSTGDNSNNPGQFSFLFTDSLTYDHQYLHAPKEQLWIPTLYLAANGLVMILINCKGIRSLERVTVLFLLVPYLCTVILAMLNFTIPSAMSYIVRCWHLNWNELRNTSLWLISFKTVVKGFSIGTLNLIFVSVHSDFHDDIMVDVVVLFVNVFLNNVLYTITLLGLYGIIKNTSAATSPNVLDYMDILLSIINGVWELPPPRWFWKFVFYSYLIGCVIAQQTFTVASVADVVISLFPKFKTNKFYVTSAVCIIFFLIGICIFAAEEFRTPSINSSFLTIGLLQSITIFWCYGYDRVSSDFHFLMGYKPSLFFQFTWVISPVLFFGVIVTELSQLRETDLTIYNNIYLITLHVLIYLSSAIVEILLLWRKEKRFNILLAEKSWGPSDPVLKQSRIIFESRIITKEHIYRQKLYEERLIKPADITDQSIVQLW